MSFWDKIEAEAKRAEDKIKSKSPIQWIDPAVSDLMDWGGADQEDYEQVWDPMHFFTPDPALTAAENEAERVRQEAATKEKQMATDTAKIQALFGTEGYDYSAYPGLEEEAAANLTAREGTLSGIRGDIMGKYTTELDEQFGRKEADVIAMLLDRGISRSTVGQSIMDRLGETYQDQEIRFSEGADAALSGIRDEDLASKNTLLDLIRTGGDYSSASTSAYEGLESSATRGLETAQAADLTNLFKSMDELYGQKQYVDAYNTGQQYGSSNIATPGSFSTRAPGTVINYG